MSTSPLPQGPRVQPSRAGQVPHLDESPDSLQGSYAGFVSRAIAWMIDYAIIFVVVLIITIGLNVFLSTRSVTQFIRFLDGPLPGSSLFFDALVSPQADAGIGVVFYLLYFVFFFSTTGQTVGKAVMGLRVVTTKGQRLGAWRALLRTICYTLSLAPLGLGYLWVLGQDRRQAWHDKIARTYVLYVWEARYEENFLRNAVYKLTKRRKSKKADNAAK